MPRLTILLLACPHLSESNLLISSTRTLLFVTPVSKSWWPQCQAIKQVSGKIKVTTISCLYLPTLLILSKWCPLRSFYSCISQIPLIILPSSVCLPYICCWLNVSHQILATRSKIWSQDGIEKSVLILPRLIISVDKVRALCNLKSEKDF